MCLFYKPMHCLRHAFEEEGFSIFLVAVAVGRGD
jgi:hypothetical protein